MNSARYLICTTLLALGTASGAHAVPTIEFNLGAGGDAPAPIGRLDCSNRLAETTNINASFEEPGITESFTLRLLFYTDADTDCLTNLGDTCPGVDISSESACGCIEANTSGIIAWSGALRSLGDLESVVCQDSTTISFRADVVFDSPDREDEVSTTIEIRTDMEAPSAPSTAPIVRAGESALVISLDEADRSNTDVENHEVCVRVLREDGASDSDGESGDELGESISELRDGFSTCSAQITALKTGEFRYENLSNDTQYEVIVAAYDAAGNRSANSDIATGQPASLLDFAELYESRLNGAEGEGGGCEMVNTPRPSAFMLLLSLLFLGRRRSR